ncbi:MAG: response regulator transcription factor [Eubacteriales bacterium]|nr:response regulator transcription factor [Eubacteriales bacterium]
MQPKQIYLVEDDENIRSMVQYALEGNGYQAMGFLDGPSFFQQMEQELPDLILLDIMLPGEDGLSILRRLRERKDTSALPILMLTAKAEEMDKVRGLDLGADDYMVKPFGILELLSRIRALLRRTGRSLEDDEKTKQTCYQYSGISVDKERHEVMALGEPVQLTKKEFELLCVLMENRGRVLSREQLMSLVWEFEYSGETRTVDIHINTLRRKIGDNGTRIQTVRGVGYKFI